jgi:hypothetical protein
MFLRVSLSRRRRSSQMLFQVLRWLREYMTLSFYEILAASLLCISFQTSKVVRIVPMFFAQSSSRIKAA